MGLVANRFGRIMTETEPEINLLALPGRMSGESLASDDLGEQSLIGKMQGG